MQSRHFASVEEKKDSSILFTRSIQKSTNGKIKSRNSKNTPWKIPSKSIRYARNCIKLRLLLSRFTGFYFAWIWENLWVMPRNNGNSSRKKEKGKRKIKTKINTSGRKTWKNKREKNVKMGKKKEKNENEHSL